MRLPTVHDPAVIGSYTLKQAGSIAVVDTRSVVLCGADGSMLKGEWGGDDFYITLEGRQGVVGLVISKHEAALLAQTIRAAE